MNMSKIWIWKYEYEYVREDSFWWLRVVVKTSQLDLLSLTPLSLAGCGRLQLGVAHMATSGLIQVVDNWPDSIPFWETPEDFTFTCSWSHFTNILV